MTKIEWTDKTWNPATGCTKISAGCTNCYAEVMAKRLQAMGIEKYKDGFNVSIHYDVLNDPMKWTKPYMVFVCSMGDLFHNDVPFDFIDKVLDVIKATKLQTYQILTKRADRMALYFESRDIPKNVWIGVTIDNSISKDRINYIRDLRANVKFLSCEPLLEDLGDMNLEGINWVIVGGESGVCARPMKEEWVLNIYNQAKRNKIPFFFKQWGTWGNDGVKRNKKVNGKFLQGKIIQQMPKTK